MGRYSGKTCRLTTMLALTASFFLVEIIVGYVTNSIALVADSFHMLSDVVALIVGFASVRISKWPAEIKRNSYGWVRAEVLGALVNAVFLLALCFSILVEALKRLVQFEEVDNPQLLLIVGAAGLLVNIIGLFLFGSHGHSHGGHGHSHGGHGHSQEGHGHSQEGHGHSQEGHGHKKELTSKEIGNGNVTKMVENEALVPLEGNFPDITIEVQKHKIASSQQLNMRGVFLHVLGDALGSVVVIVSALVIWFAEGEWKYYLDPSMSILMVLIILCTTIPLLKESAFILLQTVPSHVNVHKIIEELEKMDGICGVHECHIWRLAGNRIVASAHIRCHGIEEYMTLAAKIKALFHKAGIHSTTIQPEFIDTHDANLEQQSQCALMCDTVGEECKGDTCCGDGRKLLAKSPLASKPGETRRVMTDSAQSGPSGYKFDKPFSSSRSLNIKFSPDGDELMLEMSEMMQPVIEANRESGDIQQLPLPEKDLD